MVTAADLAVDDRRTTVVLSTSVSGVSEMTTGSSVGTFWVVAVTTGSTGGTRRPGDTSV